MDRVAFTEDKSRRIPISNLEKWIDDLGFREIRKCHSVQRLKRVRFLGTMPYTVVLRQIYNRYEHTLCVAQLAESIARQVDLSVEARRLVVLIALLHDIGHLPFSHASEVFFRQTWGKYHTGHGSRLTRHLIRSLQISGKKDLAEEVKQASAILGGKKNRISEYENKVIREIFHGHLSADTLDGISRAADSIGLPYPQPRTIIEGFFKKAQSLCLSEKVLPLVDQFFQLKEHVYRDYVYSSRGLAAEAMLTRALELTFPEFTDKSEFLSLDDDHTLEKLHNQSEASQLIEKLEAGNLFCSLHNVSPEKHELFVALFNKLCSQGNDLLAVKRTLEQSLIRELNLKDMVHLILHLNIQEDFRWLGNTQYELFNLPMPLEKLSSRFRTNRTFGETLDFFFSEELLNDIRAIRIPNIFTVDQTKGVYRKIIKNDVVDKHRGSYMTPPRIADFIVDWAVQSPKCLILDPSSGEGVFLKASLKRLKGLGCTANSAIKQIFGTESEYEYWAESLTSWPKGREGCPQNIVNEDFFNFTRAVLGTPGGACFDAVVGNPPYISFHRFYGEERKKALGLAKELGISLSERASSWAPYVICSAKLLKPDGRFGMVLPAELLTTDYAQPVRNLLKERFKSLTFIFFKKYVFASVQEDVLLLLGSNDEPFGMRRIEIDDVDCLSKNILREAQHTTHVSKWLSSKWTNMITSESILMKIDALLGAQKLCLFANIASISIGLVTGDNSFFLLSAQDLKEHKIGRQWLIPIINKASAVPGAIFGLEDWDRLHAKNSKCFMLRIPNTANISGSRELMKYIEHGRRKGLDERYKCRNRWPWYSVPMQSVPDAFLTYMSGRSVRFVLNSAQVHSTNTIHNVSFADAIGQEALKAHIVAFYSSLTGLSLEIMGRAYGGGVLKIEIGEARKVLFPNFSRLPSTVVKKLSGMLEKLDEAIRADSAEVVVSEIDRLILCEGLELTLTDCKRMADERRRLSERRMLR